MNKRELTLKIKALALEAGFDKVGVGAPELAEKRETDIQEWLERGFAGTMAYMVRDGKKRARPREVMPGAKSVISLALNYYHPDDPKPVEDPPRSVAGKIFGKIARYARGRDYHRVIEKKLKRLMRAIRETAGESLPGGINLKPYVDTGPIMEKAFAQAAGIGFYGKNTLILTREMGSWLFLANLITDLDLDHDTPHAGSCGSCKLCIEACPTDALVEPFKLDATKCISFWTIEAREEIPAAIAGRMGGLVFGCDICQDVCPYNHRPKVSRETEFAGQSGKGTWMDLEKSLALSEEEFQKEFQGTALKRSKRDGMRRNIRAVLSSLGAWFDGLTIPSEVEGPLLARDDPEHGPPAHVEGSNLEKKDVCHDTR